MLRYRARNHTTLVVIILLVCFSAVQMSLVVHQYVYASNISCNHITDLMQCSNQQSLRTSPDDNDLVIDKGVIDSSIPDAEKDEIPLLIPDISPTIDDDDNDDGGATKREGNSKDSSDRDDDSGNNGDDLDTTIPSLLPFP